MLETGSKAGGDAMPKVTAASLKLAKQRGEKFTCLTAYDATFAALFDKAGIDVLLVGDSLGMVIQGHDSTIPVTLDEITYHCRAVATARPRALVMADMPFMSFATVDQALASAACLMQRGGAEMVKLEGSDKQVEIIRALADQGVASCAHLGLRPQSVHKLGGYRVQGRDEDQARRLLAEASAMEAAGADMILLECVPAELAADITGSVRIPVLGIGAGNSCDGQVLVSYDLLGLTQRRIPRFVKNYLTGHDSVESAVQAYIDDVKSGRFPGPEHSF